MEVLAASDPVMRALAQRNGTPPLWPRPPGFATLTHLVLEQQVSLASAAAALRRLEEAIGVVEPETFLTLDDDELRRIGFSRQKAGYVRGIAAGLADGSIDLEILADLNDDEATERLLQIRGVGAWTAACYLLFVLRRPDVWPVGDRALHVAIGDAFTLTSAPDAEAAHARAESWRPLRSVAARLLWHDYLGGSPEGQIQRAER
ncbi:MAG: DNA-3-methyladenine glycosylase 2 family protein [Actinomycetota bacterium]